MRSSCIDFISCKIILKAITVNGHQRDLLHLIQNILLKKNMLLINIMPFESKKNIALTYSIIALETFSTHTHNILFLLPVTVQRSALTNEWLSSIFKSPPPPP